jgi:hypothetical protein
VFWCAIQSRYVGYYEQILQRGGQLPEKALKRIKTVHIDVISGIGKGNGSDLTLHLICDKSVVFELPLHSSQHVQVHYSYENDRLTVELEDKLCPLFAGDVAIKVHCSTVYIQSCYDPSNGMLPEQILSVGYKVKRNIL